MEVEALRAETLPPAVEPCWDPEAAGFPPSLSFPISSCVVSRDPPLRENHFLAWIIVEKKKTYNFLFFLSLSLHILWRCSLWMLNLLTYAPYDVLCPLTSFIAQVFIRNNLWVTHNSSTVSSPFYVGPICGIATAYQATLNFLHN